MHKKLIKAWWISLTSHITGAVWSLTLGTWQMMKFSSNAISAKAYGIRMHKGFSDYVEICKYDQICNQYETFWNHPVRQSQKMFNFELWQTCCYVLGTACWESSSATSSASEINISSKVKTDVSSNILNLFKAIQETCTRPNLVDPAVQNLQIGFQQQRTAKKQYDHPMPPATKWKSKDVTYSLSMEMEVREFWNFKSCVLGLRSKCATRPSRQQTWNTKGKDNMSKYLELQSVQNTLQS